MCANPKVNNEVLASIITYQEITLKNDDSIKSFIKEAKTYISKVLSDEVADSKEVSKLSSYEKSCVQDYVTWFEFYLRGYSGNEDIDEFLSRVTLENKNKEGTACNLYIREKKKQLETYQNEMKNGQFPQYGGGGYNIIGGQPSGMGIGSNMFGQAILEQTFDLQHLWPLVNQSKQVEEAREKLLEMLSVDNINNSLSPNDVVEILNTDNISCRPDSDNVRILSNLLGEFNYINLEDESANPKSSGSRNFSSYNLMISFNKVSLSSKKIKNKSDRARNKACESFKF